MVTENLPSTNASKAMQEKPSLHSLDTHARQNEFSQSPVIKKYQARTSLWWKLIGLGGTFSLILGVLIFYTNVQLSQVSENNVTLHEKLVPGIIEAQALQRELLYAMTTLRQWIQTGDSTFQAQQSLTWNNIERLSGHLKDQAKTSDDTDFNVRIVQLLAQLEAINGLYFKIQQDFPGTGIVKKMENLFVGIQELIQTEASVAVPENIMAQLLEMQNILHFQITMLQKWSFSSDEYQKLKESGKQLNKLVNELDQRYQPLEGRKRYHQFNSIKQNLTNMEPLFAFFDGNYQEHNLATIEEKTSNWLKEFENVIQFQMASMAKHQRTLKSGLVQLNFLHLIYALSVLGALIISLIAIYLIIIKPITQLYDFTQRVGDGEKNLRIYFNQKDELGALALSLSEMVAKLENAYVFEHQKSRDLYDEMDAMLLQIERIKKKDFEAQIPYFDDPVLAKLSDGLNEMLLQWKADQEEQEELQRHMVQINSMVENVPLAMMIADKKDIIRYINRTGMQLMERIAHTLPFPPSDVIGHLWQDIVQETHIISEFQKSRGKSLTTEVQIDKDIFAITTSPVYDKNVEYQGPMFSWNVVTDLRHNERNQKEIQIQQQKQASKQAERVENLKKFVQAVGQGNYSVKIPDFEDSSLEELSHGLKNMINSLQHARDEESRQIHRLKDISVELKEIAQLVEKSSRDMTDTVEKMVHFSGVTNNQTNSVLTAIQEINSNVSGIATAVEEMSVTTKEIANSVADSAEISKKAVQASREARDIVTDLGKNSEQIGNVTGVIHRIAQQTNLLALNATIEAASAGDAGKGFAVVAKEVKLLAQQTAQATEDITSSILTIQRDVTHAISSIASVSEVISEMNEISENVSSATEEQSSTTNDIARAMSDAAHSVEEVVNNIQVVAKTIEDTRT
ncbi:MAG: HAMP domain-containing protein, partial [SAR324 cluster bacterium]|nr:HAMP domain-containing protein [SAR324 cluster bacterium]